MVGDDDFRLVDLDMPQHFIVPHELVVGDVFSIVYERAMELSLEEYNFPPGQR